MENNNTILVHIGTMSMDFHPCPTIDQQADCEASNDESNAVAGKGKSAAVPPVPGYDRIPTAASTD